MKRTFNHLNFEYMFERRRYGATGTMNFYTWLIYRKVGSLEWQSYGDPWPKPRLNQRELKEALGKITFRLIVPGQHVRLSTGATAVVNAKHEENFHEVLTVTLEELNKTFEVPASVVVEVQS